VTPRTGSFQTICGIGRRPAYRLKATNAAVSPTWRSCRDPFKAFETLQPLRSGFVNPAADIGLQDVDAVQRPLELDLNALDCAKAAKGVAANSIDVIEVVP
jgi:hypothetical protein